MLVQHGAIVDVASEVRPSPFTGLTPTSAALPAGNQERFRLSALGSHSEHPPRAERQGW
jgi:hypothetical protein